jgi:outer membrane protein assembly factor BamB
VAAQETYPLWTYSENEAFRVGQLVVGDMVFVGLGRVGVHALNGSDGRVVWSTGGLGSVFSLAVGDGIVLAASGRDVYALNQSTGDLVWQASGTSTSACVAASDGRVYVGFEDSRVQALDDETGGLIWVYSAGGRVVSIAAGNGMVYVRSAGDGFLHALDGASGTLLWAFDAMRTLDRPPVSAGGMVFVASGREVYALEAATGGAVWSYESDSWVSSSPATADGSVLVGLEGRVDVLNNATGELTWSLDLAQETSWAYPAAPHEMCPVAAEGRMFLLSTFGLRSGEQGTHPWEAWVSAFDLSTHEEIWSYPIGDVECTTGAPVVLDGQVLIGVSYGRQQMNFPFKVFAFGMEPGQGVCPVCLGASLGQISVEPREFLLEGNEVDEEQNLTVSVYSDGFEGDLSFRMYVDWAWETVSMNYAAPGQMTYMDQLEWGPLGHLESEGTLEATIRFKLGLASGVSIEEPLSARCWVVILPTDCFSGYFSWDLYWDLRSREERFADFVVTMLPEGHEDVFGGCTGVGLGPVVLTPKNLTVRVGEEVELLLNTSSGGLGSLRYEGNISLDWDRLILVKHPTRNIWGAMVEGLNLEYYVDRAYSDPWGYLGFLEAGGLLTRSIRFKILASQSGEDGVLPPTEPIEAWVRLVLVPSQCDDWERQEQARRYSNWIELTILPPAPTRAAPEIVWERASEGVIDDFIGLARSEDGGFVIAGRRRLPEAGGEEKILPLLLKVDGDGNKLWERLYGADGMEDNAQCVVGTDDGGILLAGARRDPETWPSAGYVMKTDEEGRRVWETASGFEEVTCIVQCEDQGCVVAGGGYDDRGEWQNSVLRLNRNGSKVWKTSCEGEQAPRCVAQCADGGFVLGGRSSLVKIDEYGRKVWDRGYAGDWEAFGAVETGDGGLILAGGTDACWGWCKSFVLKVDPHGNMLWNRTFDRGFRSVERVEDGFAFAAGRAIFEVDDDGALVWERDLGPDRWHAGGVVGCVDGGLVVAGTLEGDLRVVRMGPEGDVVWDVVLGDADWFGGVVQGDDGGLVAAGWTHSSGSHTRDAYLLRVDRLGNDVWEKAYGDDGWESASCIAPAEDGFGVAGWADDGLGLRDTYVLRVGAGGDRLWERTYPVPAQDDWAECLVAAGDGGFVVGGGASREGGSEIRLLRIDGAGGLVWQRTYSFHDWSYIYGMVASDDGGFVLVGETYQEGGESDALVLKTDGRGALMWGRTFGGSWSDAANCILGDGSGGYVVGGYTGSFRSGNEDAYLFALDGNGSLVWEKNYWGYGRNLVGIGGCRGGGYMGVGEWSWRGMYLLRVDGTGDRIWEDRREGYPTSMIDTVEGIYVVAGRTDGPRAHLVGFREVSEISMGSPLLLVIMSLILTFTGARFSHLPHKTVGLGAD